MTFPKGDYGTPEYYAELLSDMFADVDVETRPDAPKNIYKGFLMAMDSWIDYHDAQLKEYRTFKAKVLDTLGTLE